MPQTSDLLALAAHFDERAAHYADKYTDQPRHLYEHEKRQRAHSTHHWINHYARAHNSSGHCLDVGCGDGRLLCDVLSAHPGWRGIGVDISEHMIHAANQRSANLDDASRAQWHSGTVTQVTDRFDIVVSLGVVGYQPDQLGFLAELAARVRPGGLLIISYGNSLSVPRQARRVLQFLRRIIHRRPNDVRFRTLRRRQVHQQLGASGLKCIEHRWLCFGLGLPRSQSEVCLSQWCEQHLAHSVLTPLIAQVALACYQRE